LRLSYQARFSTFDYSVKSGGTYTATVYDGDKVYCSKPFKVVDNGCSDDDDDGQDDHHDQ
jgi:hypothetical protein